MGEINMSDKRKYRVYVEFEDDYTDVEAKDENEAEELATQFYLHEASIYTKEIEEIEDE